jgi:diacylglycerol kinase (ATP)
MTAKVILNPYSNRWNARKRWPEADAALHAAGIDFELAVSNASGHISRLAEQAVLDGFSPLIIAGGDGTLCEAINGLAPLTADDVPLPPIGILPMGTANDLAWTLKIPSSLDGAARIIAAGKIGRVDLGKVNDRYFATNSALGLEPYVSLIQNRFDWIRGITRYLLSAVLGILDKPAWNAHMEWDDNTYDGMVSLIYIGNGPRSGGIFYMAPHASLVDGKLTVVFGYRATRRGLFSMLPKAMKPGPGNWTESEGIHGFSASWLKIHLDCPSPAHTDGEIFSTAITDLEYCIFPGRLQIFIP